MPVAILSIFADAATCANVYNEADGVQEERWV